MCCQAMSSVYSAASRDTSSPPSTATSFESPPPAYLTATTVRLLHATATPQPSTQLRVTFQDSPAPRRGGIQVKDFAASPSPGEPKPTLLPTSIITTTTTTTHPSPFPSKLAFIPPTRPTATKTRDFAISASSPARAPPPSPPPPPPPSQSRPVHRKPLPLPRPSPLAPPPPTDRLTSLPPELLLQILGHLPSAASLLPLSQTSTYLQSFILGTHARSIVNALITVHHAASAALLGAQVNESGWLVPTRRCVLEAEQKVVRERVQRSGCMCGSCREVLLDSSSAPGSDGSLEREGGRWNCLSPSAAALWPSRRHTHTPIPTPFLLTLPGPLFLVFLERYEWELSTRHAMRQAAPATPAQQREDERRFDFVVGHWLVRRFLDDVERDFGAGVSGPSRSRSRSRWEEKSGWVGDAEKWESNRERVQRYLSRVRGSVGGARAKMADAGDEPKKLFFGEITPPLSSPPSSSPAPPFSSSSCSSSSSSPTWTRGLLWYYGIPTPAPAPLDDDPRAAPAPPQKQRKVPPSPFAGEGADADADEDEDEIEAQARSCMAGLSHGVRKAGRKAKMVLGVRS
ncbi:hypothetical protein QTJ16_003044 [Diplocarpon rosae]|uniref:F-box domain-containing protein n=1 Tax=Diplocarpon rosae TaxID=946125 RepID=A0AAD9WEA3_9HELO|nr:hypothetical protein QTJ16_003044 [Diplocarpon rosae]